MNVWDERVRLAPRNINIIIATIILSISISIIINIIIIGIIVITCMSPTTTSRLFKTIGEFSI